jgi:hypothetical protein
MQEGIIKVTM